MRSYVIGVLISTAALCLSVAGFNWAVDPFDIRQGGRSTRGASDPGLPVAYAHTVQIHRAFALPIDSAAIGTSRTGVGLDPQHPGMGAGRSLNLTIPGMRNEESMRLAEALVARSAVKRIVWGLDLVAFNCARAPSRDSRAERFVPPGEIRMLASLETLEASLESLLDLRAKDSALVRLASDGRLLLSERLVAAGNGHRALTGRVEAGLLQRVYLPPFSLACLEREGPDPLDHFRSVLRQAHARGIDLRLFVSPCNARLWETLRASGRWAVWEQWKTELVRINHEEAERAGAAPFALWDFSGFNSLTNEPFPAEGDAQTSMRWYWESSHYKKELGDIVLDRIFGYHDPGRAIPGDFGRVMTRDNVPAHLARIRDEREAWAGGHPHDVGEIWALAERLRRAQRLGH